MALHANPSTVWPLFCGPPAALDRPLTLHFVVGSLWSYDSVLNLVQSLGNGCTTDSAQFAATQPHGLGYDNLNISTSVFVEQRGASGPAKVTSGTFGVLYGLRDANFDDMLIAPIMQRPAGSTGLHFNHDIRPSSEHLRIFHDQLLVTVIETLLIYNEGFEDVAKHPSLQHQPIRAIPACGTNNVTKKTSPQGDLFTIYVPSQSQGWAGTGTCGTSCPGYHPHPPAAPQLPSSSAIHPQLSSDPPEEDVSYPSITNFVATLILAVPQCEGHRSVGETLDSLHFYQIDETVALTVDELGTERFGFVIPGDATYLLNKVRREVKRLDKMARRAHRS
ncbi:hypothetical protein B0H13DRAFT_2439624 [Mycena leptocephala]|nr:hypothetical protein B0H13DRAFT_2439624 [Mycena leptocephala]